MSKNILIEDNSLELSKLTLVMPTSRRQDFVLRNISYWSNSGVTLLVLDNSPNAIEDSIIKSFGKNIIYKHDKRTFEKRIFDSFSFINTKYSQLIGDDEFYIKSAVISSIKELERDESLISCTGCCLKFVVDKEDRKIYSRYVYPRLYNNYKYTIQEDPKKRLNLFMKNYQPFPIYAITRSNVWKKAFELISNSKRFNFWSSDEIQVNMYLIFFGKSKVIRELLWLRSEGENLNVRDLNYDLTESQIFIDEWWNFNKSERIEFIDKLSEAFKKINFEKNFNYKDVIISSYENFLISGAGRWEQTRMNYIKDEKGILVFYLFLIVNFIKKKVPKKIKNFIKSLKIWKKKQNLLLEGAVSLKKKGIKVDHQKLSEIQKIIENFHFK